MNSTSEINQCRESAGISTVIVNPTSFGNQSGMIQMDHAPNKMSNFENEVTLRTKISNGI